MSHLSNNINEEEKLIKYIRRDDYVKSLKIKEIKPKINDKIDYYELEDFYYLNSIPFHEFFDRKDNSKKPKLKALRNNQNPLMKLHKIDKKIKNKLNEHNLIYSGKEIENSPRKIILLENKSCEENNNKDKKNFIFYKDEFTEYLNIIKSSKKDTWLLEKANLILSKNNSSNKSYINKNFSIKQNKFFEIIIDNVLRKVNFIDDKNIEISQDDVINLLKEESEQLNKNLDILMESKCNIKSFSTRLKENDGIYLLPIINSISNDKKINLTSFYDRTINNIKSKFENFKLPIRNHLSPIHEHEMDFSEIVSRTETNFDGEKEILNINNRKRRLKNLKTLNNKIIEGNNYIKNLDFIQNVVSENTDNLITEFQTTNFITENNIIHNFENEENKNIINNFETEENKNIITEVNQILEDNKEQNIQEEILNNYELKKQIENTEQENIMEIKNNSKILEGSIDDVIKENLQNLNSESNLNISKELSNNSQNNNINSDSSNQNISFHSNIENNTEIVIKDEIIPLVEESLIRKFTIDMSQMKNRIKDKNKINEDETIDEPIDEPLDNSIDEEMKKSISLLTNLKITINQLENQNNIDALPLINKNKNRLDIKKQISFNKSRNKSVVKTEYYSFNSAKSDKDEIIISEIKRPSRFKIISESNKNIEENNKKIKEKSKEKEINIKEKLEKNKVKHVTDILKLHEGIIKNKNTKLSNKIESNLKTKKIDQTKAEQNKIKDDNSKQNINVKHESDENYKLKEINIDKEIKRNSKISVKHNTDEHINLIKTDTNEEIKRNSKSNLPNISNSKFNLNSQTKKKTRITNKTKITKKEIINISVVEKNDKNLFKDKTKVILPAENSKQNTNNILTTNSSIEEENNSKYSSDKNISLNEEMTDDINELELEESNKDLLLIEENDNINNIINNKDDFIEIKKENFVEYPNNEKIITDSCKVNEKMIENNSNTSKIVDMIYENKIKHLDNKNKIKINLDNNNFNQSNSNFSDQNNNNSENTSGNNFKTKLTNMVRNSVNNDPKNKELIQNLFGDVSLKNRNKNKFLLKIKSKNQGFGKDTKNLLNFLDMNNRENLQKSEKENNPKLKNFKAFFNLKTNNTIQNSNDVIGLQSS